MYVMDYGNINPLPLLSILFLGFIVSLNKFLNTSNCKLEDCLHTPNAQGNVVGAGISLSLARKMVLALTIIATKALIMIGRLK